jgi:small subunit ribosomal protein S6
MYFQAPGPLIQRLERELQINDDVLRYLTLRMDAKMKRHYEKRKKREAREEEEAEQAAAEEENASEEEGDDE